ncbi:hypothetical protein AAMO2058_000984100 [Amorphochlora amoebiformis]
MLRDVARGMLRGVLVIATSFEVSAANQGYGRIRSTTTGPAPTVILRGLRGGGHNRRVSTRSTKDKGSSTVEDRYTVKDTFFHEELVKKSRFLTYAHPIANPKDAMDFLEAVRDDTASHNCWAYKIGDEYRFSDDGEPSGTAGKPIFQAIQYSGLESVMVVVTRFFGGIKLGAGGLVRAYGGAASSCLRNAPRAKIIEMSVIRVGCAPDLIGVVFRYLSNQKDVNTDYQDDGTVVVTAKVVSSEADGISDQIQSSTQMRAKVEVFDAGSCLEEARDPPK